MRLACIFLYTNVFESVIMINGVISPFRQEAENTSKEYIVMN